MWNYKLNKTFSIEQCLQIRPWCSMTYGRIQYCWLNTKIINSLHLPKCYYATFEGIRYTSDIRSSWICTRNERHWASSDLCNCYSKALSPTCRDLCNPFTSYWAQSNSAPAGKTSMSPLRTCLLGTEREYSHAYSFLAIKLQEGTQFSKNFFPPKDLSTTSSPQKTFMFMLCYLHRNNCIWKCILKEKPLSELKLSVPPHKAESRNWCQSITQDPSI